jgi:hypothetical protein
MRVTDATVTSEERAAALFDDYARGRPTLKAGEDDDTAIFDTFDWAEAQRWFRKWLPIVSRADRLSEVESTTPCKGKTGTRKLYCRKPHAALARIRRFRGKRSTGE